MRATRRVGSYVWAVYKHWRGFLLGEVPLLATWVYDRLRIRYHWTAVTMPGWVWVVLAILGLLVAQFLAWREADAGRTKAESERDEAAQRQGSSAPPATFDLEHAPADLESVYQTGQGGGSFAKVRGGSFKGKGIHLNYGPVKKGWETHPMRSRFDDPSVLYKEVASLAAELRRRLVEYQRVSTGGVGDLLGLIGEERYRKMNEQTRKTMEATEAFGDEYETTLRNRILAVTEHVLANGYYNEELVSWYERRGDIMVAQVLTDRFGVLAEHLKPVEDSE